MKHPVLLLNASEEIISVIGWRKAVKLYLNDSVEKPYGFDDYYDIKLPRGNVFKLPCVLMLKQYVLIPVKRLNITKNNIFKRDGYICQYCSKKTFGKDATIDHILPRSRGGRHRWENVVCCCKSCNEKKADRKPEECGMRLLSTPKVPKAREILTYNIGENVEKWSRWTKTL